MSYIERIRGPQQTNVVPINGAKREPAEGLHPYAAAIRQAWLDRLDNLASRPWVQGDAWDTNCFVTARKLIELANSTWAGYSHGDARGDYFDHAPADSKWDQREKCWQQAEKKAASVMLPEPDPSGWTIPDPTVLDEAVRALAVDQADKELGDLVRDRFPLLDFTELLGTEDDGEEWIIEPLIPARRLVALFSAPKVGKSLLMLDLACGIALGKSTLGVVPEARKVLYVDFENDPRGDIKRRLEAMGYNPEDGAALNEGLKYLSYPTLAKLDTHQGGFELVAVAQEYGCDVIVIDTVSRAVGGEENDNDTWLNFYRNTGLALKQAGIACIRLDHSGKDLEKGMRGGSAKYGDVDAVWKLTAASETVLDLVCTDHRMQVEEKQLMIVRESYPYLHHKVSGDRRLALDAREQEIDKAIEALDLPRDTSGNEVFKRLKDAGNGYNRQLVLRVVKARKLILQGGSGTTLEPPGTTTGEVVPSAPLRSRALEPPVATGSPEPEPVDESKLFKVACKKCYSKIHRDAARAGLCPNCAKEAGLAP